MFRHKSFAIAVALLLVIALLAITLDADASYCAYWYSQAMYYYANFLVALSQYGWDHWLTQYYYSGYQYYWNLYIQNCGGG